MKFFKNNDRKKSPTYENYKSEIRQLFIKKFGEDIGLQILADMSKNAADIHLRSAAESLNIANLEIKNLSLEIKSIQNDKQKLSNLNVQLQNNIEKLKNEISILEKQEVFSDMIKKIPSFTGSNNYEDETTAPIRYYKFQSSMERIFKMYKCSDTEKLCYFDSKLEDGAKTYLSRLRVSTYEEAIQKFRENYFNPQCIKKILLNELRSMKIGYNETFRMFGLKIMELVDTIKFYKLKCDESFLFDIMTEVLLFPLKSSVKIHPSVMEAIANGDFLSLIKNIDHLIVIVPSLIQRNRNSYVEQILDELSSTKQVVVNHQRQDRKYGHICKNITCFNDYVIIDKLLFYKKNNGLLALCIPVSLKNNIKWKLKKIKEKSDIIKVCQKLIWPFMKTDLRSWFRQNFKFL